MSLLSLSISNRLRSLLQSRNLEPANGNGDATGAGAGASDVPSGPHISLDESAPPKLFNVRL